MPVLEEIRSQVKILPKVFEWVLSGGSKEVVDLLKRSKSITFVGCGSSHYAGIVLSRYSIGVLRKPSLAIVGGELLLSPDWVVPELEDALVVFVSRSGETTEVVEGVDVLKKRGFKTVGLTLEDGSSLVERVDVPVVLPYSETSIVMTSSFTGMILTFQVLMDMASGNFEEYPYKKLIESLGDTMELFKREVKDLSKFSHYVFLGSGPYEGIARESALKLQEMSLTYTEAYTTLDYRHGPKSLVDDKTLVVIFGDGEEERKLASEMEDLGGKAIVRKRLSDSYRDSFVQVIFSQLLGYEIALRKGVDVEKPRNLTKVVKLNG